MKKIVFAFSLLVGVAAMAQQKPHYTQYIMNQYIINPALSGIENYTDIKVSHRHQWVGFNGEEPVTTYFTIHAPLGKTDTRTTATSFDMANENPRGNAYWESYTAAEPHHGIGLQVLNDRTFALNRFSINATYAYHIGLGAQTSLAGGIAFGMSNMSLNASKLNFAVPVDPAVAGTGFLNTWQPDLTIGLYLYGSNYFAGFSAQNIFPSKVEFAEGIVRQTSGKQVPHMFAHAGFLFFLSDEINCTPSVMLRYVNPQPIGADLNVKLQYLDKAWLAVGARYNDGISGMFGLNVSSTLNVGYAYDYTTSRLNNFAGATHELMLGFTLGNRYGDWCPRNVW
jgi:type IX secretion system PorP/SprF family membrane protein